MATKKEMESLLDDIEVLRRDLRIEIRDREKAENAGSALVREKQALTDHLHTHMEHARRLERIIEVIVTRTRPEKPEY